MNYENLLSGFLFALGAYGFYLFHKSWHKTVTKKQSLHKISILGRTITHWMIIIGLSISSFVYLLLALID